MKKVGIYNYKTYLLCLDLIRLDLLRLDLLRLDFLRLDFLRLDFLNFAPPRNTSSPQSTPSRDLLCCCFSACRYVIFVSPPSPASTAALSLAYLSLSSNRSRRSLWGALSLPRGILRDCRC